MSQHTFRPWLALPLAALTLTPLVPRAYADEAVPEKGAQQAASRPNVVVFLADDLGWADTSVTGSRFYETPNLARLAQEGSLFRAAYISPADDATRAGLLTGRYPVARLKLSGGKVSRNPTVPESAAPDQRLVPPERVPGLLTEEVTLAELMHKADYTTWFAGQWDVGPAGAPPNQQGFDRVAQVGKRLKSHFAPYGVPGFSNTKPGTYLADRLTDQVLKWMEWEQRGGRPFFLLLAHRSVREPWEAKPELVEKYRRKAAAGAPDAPQRNPVMGAMVASLDESLGRILDKLDELGIADETLVIFLSGGGGVTQPFEGAPLTSNAPLRGGNGSMFEGGIRVPLVVRWPGVTTEPRSLDAPVSHVDLFPTLVAAIGEEPPADLELDGEDLGPLLRGQTAARQAPVFVHYTLGEGASVVRDGHWKLIRYHGSGPQGAPRDALYDLQADVGESSDLADSQPAKAAEMASLLEAWLGETGALLPVPNPAYRGPAANP